MEKKTIGGFISALRKANGMTQKDLAERLNVSDKTVSRWECDEGAPDLSLIPVIAEIFGVSCDELLRGERKSPAQRAEQTETAPQESETTPRGEKQRQRILKTALAQYKNRTYISMGISVIGLIAALICNLAFMRAVLGFLVGAIFFAASIVCQTVFLNRAFFSVDEEEFNGLPELNGFKRTAVRLTELSIGLTVSFIGFTFPLILLDAYVGLGADSMLLFGLAGAAVFLLIFAIACFFVNAHLLKTGTYTLSDREAQIYHHNHRLKKVCGITLAVLLAATVFVHQLVSNVWDAYAIMEGTEFTEYAGFAAFMEQDMSRYERYDDPTAETAEAPGPEDHVIYYSPDGRIITEEEYLDEYLRRTIEDENGNTVCEYIVRNENVLRISYDTDEDGSALPITVYTYNDLEDAKNSVTIRNLIFTAAYIIESAGVLIAYFRRRAR